MVLLVAAPLLLCGVLAAVPEHDGADDPRASAAAAAAASASGSVFRASGDNTAVSGHVAQSSNPCLASVRFYDENVPVQHCWWKLVCPRLNGLFPTENGFCPRLLQLQAIRALVW